MKVVRHESGPRFSEMVVVDAGSTRTLYLSGQVAEDPSLDITGQARDVLGHIDRLLALAGASKRDLVSTTVYLRSVGDYAAMNAVWDEWVAPGHAPARATVEARLIDSDYRIEIQATAVMAVPTEGGGDPEPRETEVSGPRRSPTP